MQNNTQYSYSQCPGCAVKYYKNDGSNKTGIIYFSIQNARVERSIGDINGSFSLTLLPDKDWDEIIAPDDYVRIFMGDNVTNDKKDSSNWNIQSGCLAIETNDDIGKTKYDPELQAQVPIGGKYGKPSYLVMYERMTGRIDRVERIEQQTEAGLKVSFSVVGRSIAGALQDITLYYNEHIPGLNAVSVFFGSDAGTMNTPSEAVKNVIALVLSTIPFPQLNVPKSLADDFSSAYFSSNEQYVKEQMDKFQTRVDDNFKSTPNTQFDPNAFNDMKRMMQSNTNSNAVPLYSLMMMDMSPTAGLNFNRSYMSITASTTGFYELLRSLSNQLMNEMWFDLCPGGKADVNTPNYKFNEPVLPTLVMRQRPYDITPKMRYDVSSILEGPMETLRDKFTQKDLKQGGKITNNDLLNLKSNAIYITGSMNGLTTNDVNLKNHMPTEGLKYIGTALQYNVGFSGGERHNGFCVLPVDTDPQNQGTHKIASIDIGGFLIDTESIQRHGFRFMQGESQYTQPSIKNSDTQNFYQIAANYTKVIGNWYYLNPWMLNGNIVCRFLPRARLGIPCYYINTRKTLSSPNGRVELFYVQGVTDEYVFGEPIKTSLQVTRGLRYGIGKDTKTVGYIGNKNAGGQA
jgi:hypothetical protein